MGRIEERMNIKKFAETFLEIFAIIFSISAISVIIYYLITHSKICLIIFEPDKGIRITEIILSILVIGILLRVLFKKKTIELEKYYRES